MRELVWRFCDSQVAPLSIEHASIRRVFVSSDGFYNFMYPCDMFMSNQVVDALETHVDRIGRHMQLWRRSADKENIRYDQVRPKVHYGMHWPEQCELMNPRFVQTFGGESLIGRITQIWEASCNGPCCKHATASRGQQAARSHSTYS